MEQQAYSAALEWYMANGVDEALADVPLDRYALARMPMDAPPLAMADAAVMAHRQTPMQGPVSAMAVPAAAPAPLGAADARDAALKLALAAQTLEDLRAAIAAFEGLGLKKTAANLVFGDGAPAAPIMYIGDAPSAEDDRSGQPFSGAEGAFVDAMFRAIGAGRQSGFATGLYVTHILNWRPPGGRSPAPGEIEASLPFIERHIQLAAPRLLVLGGGTVAKALLGRADPLSKLRRKWHDYTPQTQGLVAAAAPIPALVTFQASSLLSAPLQKRGAWADLLEIKKKIDA